MAGTQLLRDRWGAFRPPTGDIRQLKHLVAVNDVWVRVRRGCRDIGYTLTVWQFAKDLGQLTERLIPDAYCQIQRTVNGDTKTAAFFLEVERARMDAKVLRSKLLAYASFISSGTYQERFGTRALRLLFVFAAEQHGETLTRRVAHSVAEAASLGLSIAHFTTLRTLRQCGPAACLTKPLWHSPRSSEPVALFLANG